MSFGPTMRFLNQCYLFYCFLSIFSPCMGRLLWRETKFLFCFGDSYSSNGFNVSAGIRSSIGSTSANGLNWIEFLGGTFNVTDTQVYDLATSGATIDSTLVPPKKTTAISLVNQTAQFNNFLASKPLEAGWESNNSLFAIWIGINDIDFAFAMNLITPQLFPTLMGRYMEQLQQLYDAGARSFLILTVPPSERSPTFLQQGPAVVEKIKPLILSFNQHINDMVAGFRKSHRDIDTLTVFDTQPLFHLLLDNAKTMGFVNSTGFCEAYVNGTPQPNTQIDPCAPVSNYFWLNDLHPLFTVHSMIAHAVSTVLNG